VSRKLKSVIIFSILLVAWLTIAPLLARILIVDKPLERADVILILAGSSTYIERTQKASQIYRQGISNNILLTDDGGFAGWSQKEQRNPPFVYLAKRELISQGIPAERIEVFKPYGSGTIYEAQLINDKLVERNWRSILIVTSAYHTRRALRTFEEETLNKRVKLGIVSPPTGQQTPPPYTWWLSLRGWRIVGGEYVKSIVYWIYY